MGVSVVVGGQFGSEGKGKVTHFLARRSQARATIRVGGPNSGHTVVSDTGERYVLRQLPSTAMLPGMLCVLPAGSYVDLEVLAAEMTKLRIPPHQVKVDESAVVVSDEARRAENDAGLGRLIGSTESGTGAAVLMRVARTGGAVLARDVPQLKPLLADTPALLRKLIDSGDRVIIEGTQGFGLSVLHARDYPFATSRDTTAAGFASEAGISPLDVDAVVMVLRSFPIRVAGNSGPLPLEVDWRTVTEEGAHDHLIEEFTSVTKKLRRVAKFDASVVRRAIQVNAPTSIVLNHLDYVDHQSCISGRPTSMIEEFVEHIERQIDRHIDYLGISAGSLIPNDVADQVAALRA